MKSSTPPSHPGIVDVGEAQLDLDRGRRCGFPEVVFAPGKTVAALDKIFHTLIDHGVDVAGHPVTPEQAAELLPRFPSGVYNSLGRTFRVPLSAEAADGQGRAAATTGRVVIVTAGTSDLPVAEEARETALWTGAEVSLIQDVGVAGPHRLPPTSGCSKGRTPWSWWREWKGPCRASWAGTSLPGDCRADQHRLWGQFRRSGRAVGNAQ